jgi:N-acetylglucosamine-6-phosphate deacetylase
MKKETKGNNIIEGIHYETGLPVRIEFHDGLIESIQEISDLKIKEAGLYVAPGLIDNQINGYAGVDFSGDNLTSNDVISAATEIWKEGVTTFLPTVLTNSHENLIKNFGILRQATKVDERISSSIPGFHLEGPYISPEEGYRGCHPLSHIRKPSMPEFDAYQQAAGGKIIQITIAPEIQGAMEFIRASFKAGIRVGIGHSNASARQIAEAAENGARL